MRVVIDTNALLVCIRKQSKYRPVWNALLNQRFELAVSSETMLEYEEVFSRQINPAITQRLMLILEELPNLIRTEVYFNWGLIIKDPDDNKFVDCAISARVRFVVTDDKHFNVLKAINFPKVDIISLDDFLEEIKQLA